ncbi:MAG: acyl carrier protein [Rhizobiales bacterium]|nr:acyl carrier protein [Hyphomicrobiales bacterium]
MTETDIKQSLTRFFLDQFKVELSSTGEDLIEAGILDSLMLIEVVMFMETEFAVTTELDDLEMENFLTIDNMARFVAERLPSAGDAGVEGRAGEQVAAAAGKGGA